MEIAHEGGRRGYYSAETIFLITLCHFKTVMNFPTLEILYKDPYKCAIHDFTIIQKTDTKTKISQERNRFILSDPQSRLSPVSALFDKRYMGVNNILQQSVILIKKPRNRNYTEGQLDYNHRVSFDQIIVER